MGEKLSVEQFDCEDENLVEEYKDFKGGKKSANVSQCKCTICINRCPNLNVFELSRSSLKE